MSKKVETDFDMQATARVLDLPAPVADEEPARLIDLAAGLATRQLVIGSGTAAPSGGADGDIYLQYT